MNLSKIKAKTQKLEENQKAIDRAQSDRARIQQAFDDAETRQARINDLQAQRDDALADELIGSGKADVSAIDAELRKLERTGGAGARDLDIAKSALSKMNQRLADLDESRKAILAEIAQVARDAINEEISALSGEIDRCIAAINAAALRGEALARLARERFGGASARANIERFGVNTNLPESVNDLNRPAEFTSPVMNVKAVNRHYASIRADFEKIGAIQSAS